MRKLYEATHRGSYAQGMIRKATRPAEFNTFSSPPVSNRERTMPNIDVFKSINYTKKMSLIDI